MSFSSCPKSKVSHPRYLGTSRAQPWYINNNLQLLWKYARIFVWGHYLFWEITVSWECSSRKTVSCKQQIMSKDKFLSLFSPQIEAIVFITTLDWERNACPPVPVLCSSNPGEHPQKCVEKTISLGVSCTFLFYSDNPRTRFTGQHAYAQFAYNFLTQLYYV